MAPKSGHVVTVEIDHDLARVALQQLSVYDNVTLSSDGRIEKQEPF